MEFRWIPKTVLNVEDLLLIFSSTSAASNAMLYLLPLAAQQWAIKPSKGGTYLYSTAELHTFPGGKRKKKGKTAVLIEVEH